MLSRLGAENQRLADEESGYGFRPLHSRHYFCLSYD